MRKKITTFLANPKRKRKGGIQKMHQEGKLVTRKNTKDKVGEIF